MKLLQFIQSKFQKVTKKQILIVAISLALALCVVLDGLLIAAPVFKELHQNTVGTHYKEHKVKEKYRYITVEDYSIDKEKYRSLLNVSRYILATKAGFDCSYDLKVVKSFDDECLFKRDLQNYAYDSTGRGLVIIYDGGGAGQHYYFFLTTQDYGKHLVWVTEWL